MGFGYPNTYIAILNYEAHVQAKTYSPITLCLFVCELNKQVMLTKYGQSVLWLTLMLHRSHQRQQQPKAMHRQQQYTISNITWIKIRVSISCTDTEHWLPFAFLSPSNHLVPFLSLMQLAAVHRRHQFSIVSNACSFRFMPHIRHTVVFIDLTCLCVWACWLLVALKWHDIRRVSQSINILENWVNAKSSLGIVVLPPSTICDVWHRSFPTKKTNNKWWEKWNDCKRKYNEHNNHNNNNKQKITMPRK